MQLFQNEAIKKRPSIALHLRNKSLASIDISRGTIPVLTIYVAHLRSYGDKTYVYKLLPNINFTLTHHVLWCNPQYSSGIGWAKSTKYKVLLLLHAWQSANICVIIFIEALPITVGGYSPGATPSGSLHGFLRGSLYKGGGALCWRSVIWSNLDCSLLRW